MKRKSFKLSSVLIFVLSLANPSLSQAGTATVSWNPNTESDLAGYKVYYGTASSTYAQVEDVDLTTAGSDPEYTLTNLTDGQTYYFAVTAYDLNGNESIPSSEVSKLIGAGTSGGGGSGGGSSGGGSSLSSLGDSGGGGCGMIRDMSGRGPQDPGAGQLIMNLALLLFIASLGKTITGLKHLNTRPATARWAST